MECNFENCGYYVDEECTICGMGTDGEDTFCKYCKDNPNCYYKQLAQLKAENEKLKECNKELTSDNLNTIQEMDNERRRVEQLKEEITELEEKFLTLNGKSYSYYLTLQEIKTIVCGNYEIIDPQGRKDILKLITKAEEE